MTDYLFNAPASADKFDAKAHKGRLLLVTAKAYKEGISTQYGVKDAVEADIVVVDEQNPRNSKEFNAAYLFGGRLISDTKGFIGKGFVLGRLDQVPTDKGNPAWVMTPPTDADKGFARAFLATKAPAL